jgi:tetratricopeptide (TPR) repeat protein
MRIHPDSSIHRRRSLFAAPLVACAIALVASACGSNASPSATSTPTNAVALLRAGVAAQTSGDLSVAIADYKQVINDGPDTTSAATADYDLGDIAQVDQKDLSAATSYYRSALAVNPDFTSALYNLAIILTPTQPLVAENYYQQVIQISPGNADAHLNLGFLYFSQGEKTQAHAQFKKATQLVPSLASRIPAADTK